MSVQGIAEWEPRGTYKVWPLKTAMLFVAARLPTLVRDAFVLALPWTLKE